ncbi:vascular cell adhesion protein 1 [Megalobrama amblycephala]|uniref:vascular cell adhesion protein 1 n=1 Tax=Megalobrama amblycephala TaxID=75352 RepID=UPI002013CEE4|nr:vascular cell adhesion protein 1 [Megalobrama amblycephala]
MCGMKCITFSLWINILNVITEIPGFELELTPPKPVIHVGKDLELTCRVNVCPGNVTFVWTALVDRYHGGVSKNERTVSHLLIKNITVKHSIGIVCKASCERQPKQKTSHIQVFSFPQDPVLPEIRSLIENQTQKLSCIVHNVYPLKCLKIEWLRGDKTLFEDEPHYIDDYDDVQNFTSQFNYTPSVLDRGKNITCKARMSSTEFGLNETRNSIAEYGPGTITTSINNPSVKLGEHLEITCHADGNPKPTILWFKEENEPALQSQNEALIINKASWSQAGWYHCNASNAVGSLQKRIKVTVLGPPNIPKIQLSHRGDPKEGENISILCSSDDGSAELTLYRQSQRTESEALNKSAVLLKIPSLQIIDAGIYVCEAKNDFGSERSTINITVEAQHNVLKMPDLPVAILPIVGSVSLLTIAGLLIRYCRKKARSNSSNVS